MECNDNQKGVLHAWKITYNANTIENMHLLNIYPKIIHERSPPPYVKTRAPALNRVCCHRDRYLVYWENERAFKIYDVTGVSKSAAGRNSYNAPPR